MRRLLVVAAVCATVAGVMFVGETRPEAQGQGLALGRPDITPAVHFDTSPAMRDIPAGRVVATRPDFEVLRPQLPERGGPDPVIQPFAVSPFPAAFGPAFPGVGANGYAPPDTVGEAGPNHYVQWVNVQWAVFDRTNNNQMMAGYPKPGNSIWAGFGGDCETRNDGDPIVQYDQLAQRWIMTQFAVRARNYLQCVAVSTSSNPDGTYYRYAFQYADFPDYPKLSVWQNAYFITFNMFKNGRTFSGGRACAYEKNAMLIGAAARQVCFQVSSPSLLPADLDGTVLPPDGSLGYVLNRGSNALNLWKFKVNWSNPSSSTFTGPTPVSGVSSFSIACGGAACIPQPQTTNKLDSLGDRLMYRLAYRNLGGSDGERMVVNHSVTAGTVTGVRWYELKTSATGATTVLNQGTFTNGNDGVYRWMGSMAMDKFGNIAAGYSKSGASTRPSIGWAGRTPSDTANTLSAEAVTLVGTGSQTGTLHRWGDYSTLSLDPNDDCTFWFTSEYIPSNGSFNWATHIGSFAFPGCATIPAPSQVQSSAQAKPTTSKPRSR